MNWTDYAGLIGLVAAAVLAGYWRPTPPRRTAERHDIWQIRAIASAPAGTGPKVNAC